MATDWLKMQKSTPDKPEVWAIATALNIDPDAVVGKLFRVWAWFDEHTEDGHALSVTKKLLDRDVSVPGFCDAMGLVGWMLDDGNVISLPNFDRHNGESAKKRALSAERKRKQRDKCHEDVPDKSRNERDKSVTREEKRREEKKEQEKTLGASGDAAGGNDGEDLPKDKSGKPQYPVEFEQIWAEKPDRLGPNPKLAAFKAYRTRLKQGATHAEILEGLRKYRRHLEAAGKIGSPHVQQMKTFLGPSEHFREMDGLQSPAAGDVPHWMRGGL